MPHGGMKEALPANGSLLDRALASSEDRQAWLEARAVRVTATEAAGLRTKGPAFRRELLAAKLAPQAEWQGNRYTDRGHEREPVIVDWVRAHWPHLAGNTTLFHAPQNPLHAATPDGWGYWDGQRLDLLEVKTSKHDLDPWTPGGYFQRTGYWQQVQWQLYVMGAQRCLFVWEQHDDAWPDPQPVDLEPKWAWIERDDQEVAAMVADADHFLAELELARSRAGLEPEAADADLDALGATVVAARRAEATAKAEREGAWKRLLAGLGDRPSFSQVGLSRVTWTNEQVEEVVPDPEAALEAPGGRELYEAHQAARLAWEQHQARFTTTRVKSAQRLTVTEPKAGGR